MDLYCMRNITSKKGIELFCAVLFSIVLEIYFDVCEAILAIT